MAQKAPRFTLARNIPDYIPNVFEYMGPADDLSNWLSKHARNDKVVRQPIKDLGKYEPAAGRKPKYEYNIVSVRKLVEGLAAKRNRRTRR